MKYDRVHIGNIIKEEVKRQKKTFTSFAGEIGIQKQNVEKKVFSKQGLDTDFLMLISEKLDCDFFEYYHPKPESNQKRLLGEIKATFSVEFGSKKQDRSFRFLLGENDIKTVDNEIKDS
jgi:transcriptional regulator with XRE-family HTH domain